MMDLENREKEGEKDYEDKKTYCGDFNGTYGAGTCTGAVSYTHLTLPTIA